MEGLIKDKQHILETEKLLLLRPLEQLFLYYPDEYAAMTVDDLPLDDYIVKIEEAYREQIDAVPDDYKEETLADSLSGKATVTVGKQDEKTDQKQDQKKDRKEDTADTGKTDGKNSSQDPADAAIDAFLANEAQCRGRDGNTFFYQDLQDAEKNYGFVYEAGPRLDLDNDGRNELILTGPYGGMFLDAENGTLAVFEEGGGTASVLSYGYYEGKCVVCHMDTSHAGRQEYHFDVYQGADQKTESFSLTAEYWDAPDQNRYDENSTFTFKDQQITMQEYEALLSEIFKK